MREQEFLIKYVRINCRKFIEKFHSWLMDIEKYMHLLWWNTVKHK